MPTDNSRNRYYDHGERLRPWVRLEVAFENVIDQHGIRRDSKADRIVHEAEWDNGRGFRFALEKRQHAEPEGYVDYSLDVYDTVSRDTWIASYGYDVLFRELKQYEVEDGVIGKKCKEEVPILIQYLDSAPTMSLAEVSEFLQIIADNPLHDPRTTAKIRRVASAVLRRMKPGNL